MVVLWTIFFFAIIMAIYNVGELIGDNEVRKDMIECMRLTKDADRCYNFVILKDYGEKVK